MNASSLDDLRERLAKSRLDSRPALVKALDLVDLPRNTLFNIIAPGVADRKRRELEFGSAGLPVVRASDILEELGVENKIARGVGGFIGDVALDPLTFLGPAKGLSLAGQGTRVGITAGGRRALRSGVRAAARGGVKDIRNARVRDIVESALSKGRGAERADRVLERLRSFTSRAKSGDVAVDSLRQDPAALLRGRLQTTARGGTIVDGRSNIVASALRGTDEPVAKASREFLDYYGKRGAGVLSVPFTPLEARLRPITSRQRQQARFLEGLARVNREGFGPARALSAAEAAAQQVRTRGEALLKLSRAQEDLRLRIDRAEQIGEDATALRASLDQVNADAAKAVRDADEARKAFKSIAATASRAERKGKALTPSEVLQAAGRAAQLRRAGQASAKTARFLEASGRDWRAVRTARLDLTRHLDDLKAAGLGPAPGEDEARWVLDQSREFVKRFDEAFADDILKIGDAELDAHVAAIDSMQDAAKALIWASANGTADLFETMGGESLDAAAVAANALGLDSIFTGASAIAEIGASFAAKMEAPRRAVLGDTLLRLDAGLRQTFGERTSLSSRLTREYLIRARDGATLNAKVTTARYLARLQQALDDLGIEKKAVEVYGDVFDLAAARYSLRYGEMDELGRVTLPQYADDDIAVGRLVRGDDGVWTVDANQPGRVAELVQRGVLGLDNTSPLYPKLLEKVDEIVDDMAEMFYDMGQQEVVADALGAPALRQFYAPKTLTPAGEQSIAQQRSLTPTRGTNQSGIAAAQAFEKPVTTRRHRVYLESAQDAVQAGETSNPEKFRVYRDAQGRLYQRFHGYDFGSTDPAMQKLVERYKAVPEAQRYAADISVWEFNRMAADGEMRGLVGPSLLGRRFFEENMLHTAAARVASHERYMASRKLVDLAKRGAVSIDPKELAQQVGGGSVVLANGMRARVVPLGRGGRDLHLKVGSKLFRSLRMSESNPLQHLIGDEGGALLYERSIAERLEEVARQMEPEKLPSAIKALDAITTLWKKTTLTHPSWVITDLVGNLFNGLAGGVRPDAYVRHAPDAMKIVTLLNSSAGSGALRRMSVRVGDSVMNGEQLARVMIEHGVVGQNFARQELLEHGARGILSSAELGRKSVPVGVSSVEELEKLSRRATPLLRASSAMGEYWNLWFRMNGQMNDAMRATAFMSFLDQGDDISEAVRKTIASHFDYGDLTRAEQSIARRLMPFYSWLRNNLAYQVRLMAENPVAFNIPGHIKEALETAILGEGQVPEHQRPGWMREQMMLQIADGTALSLINVIPQADLFNYAQAITGAEGAQETLRQLVSSVNPVISAPAQIGAGREFFTGREIAPDRLSGDQSAGRFLLNMVRPVREIGVTGDGPIPRAFEDRGVAGAAGRVALGGRVQDFSQERRERFILADFRDREHNLRRAISAAQRDGRDADSLAARARLMLVYREMVAEGFESEVPEWARRQLLEISGPGARP